MQPKGNQSLGLSVPVPSPNKIQGCARKDIWCKTLPPVLISESCGDAWRDIPKDEQQSVLRLFSGPSLILGYSGVQSWKTLCTLDIIGRVFWIAELLPYYMLESPLLDMGATKKLNQKHIEHTSNSKVTGFFLSHFGFRVKCFVE